MTPRITSSRIERPIAPTDLVRVTFRHKGKVLIWVGLVTGISIAALFALPRKYESEAKLFLRLGRESVALDPTATTGATVQVQESRENQLNSARDMLKSRALLERVVAKLGAEAILKSPPGPSQAGVAEMATNLIRAVSSLASLCTLSTVSPEEKAVDKLSKSIGVSLAKNSSVINVSCVAKTPQLAQEIMQEFLDAYQQQHLAANHTVGSSQFFSTQAAQLKKELDATLGELRDAKNESSLVSIPVEQQAVQNQLTQIEAARLAANSSLASNEASIASLRKSLDNLPENLTTQQTTGFPNVAADHMQQEFFKLQISVNELQAKLGDGHPLVKIAREQSLRLAQILDRQATDRTQTTTGVNLSRQTLDLDLRREEALAASLRAKAAVLTDQYAGLQQRLRTLNEQEVRINELERRAAIAATNYRSYADHLEQARIGDALEANRISNVNIVQPPSLVEQPVSPKPLFVLGVAVVAICGGSLGLVFGSEYLGRSLISIDEGHLHDNLKENESRLSVPVLGTISAPRNNQVYVNR